MFSSTVKVLGTIGLVAAVASMSGCKGGGGGDDGDPAEELTLAALFAGGTLVNGTPPAPTGNPTDPMVSAPGPLNTKIYPGTQNALPLTITQIDPAANYNVNIQFGGASSYIQVPMPAAGGVSTTQNIDVPFNIGDAVCASLGSREFTIDCVYSVDAGAAVSNAQMVQVELDCDLDRFTDRDFSFCAFNYPRLACESLQNLEESQNPLGFEAAYNPGQGSDTCSAFGSVDQMLDFGGIAMAGTFGELGACVLSYNLP